MMAAADNPSMPLRISLVRIGGQELGHLRVQRLSNQLLGARSNQVRQRIFRVSIFLLRFGTLLHRGVSSFCGCVWMSRNTHCNPRRRVFSTHSMHYFLI